MSLSQMGAIIDFSTGAAFCRHWADQVFVQLERESNGHLYLPLVEDMLSQPISNKEQLQGFQAAAQVQENLEKSEEKHGCLAASSQHHITHDSDIRQHNEQVPTDTPQTRTTSPDSHSRQHRGPMQHYTTVFAPLSVNTNEIDSDVSIRSRCTQEGRMPSTDGTSGRGTTATWRTGVGTEVHDQGAPFCERRGTGETPPGFRKDEPEPAGRESTTATDSGMRESHERTPDQDHEGRPYATIDAEGVGLPGFRQVRSQDV